MKEDVIFWRPQRKKKQKPKVVKVREHYRSLPDPIPRGQLSFEFEK